MYENKLSTATLGGHGLGGKIALAAACYLYDKVTGYFGIDSTPMNQFYHEPVRELRQILDTLSELNINRSYASINAELKRVVLCPKWRSLFLNCLFKSDTGYTWNFNFNAVHSNLAK